MVDCSVYRKGGIITEAKITSIQRFSLNDGPGIRSTVFFQGCNMRCAWCHNPETLTGRPVLMHYENKCIGCGKCFEVCPKGAHKIKDGKHIIDRTLCVSCGKCAANCFAEALVMSSRAYTVDEVMDEIRQDKLYYDESGGGVTVSGGEASLHADFIIELARRCHAEGISIAIESNMFNAWAVLEPLLREMDLIMCDMKHMDSPSHKRLTGVDNQLIINNIGRASLLGIPMIVRTPLIPGATDDITNLRAIAEYMAKLKNIRYYELLNFNPLGGAKRIAMDAEDLFADSRPFSKKHLEELCGQLDGLGIKIKVS